jgi:hypothetical protein
MERLIEIFKKYSISIAYLFGSQREIGLEYLLGKKVEIDKTSDLDIGLLLKSLPSDMYRFYGDLYYELSEVFEPFNIDIVFLNEVNYLMKYEIICGHRIYAEDEEFADEYEEIVVKIASDLAFKQKLFEEDFLEAIEDGHFEIKLK